ncbi:BlaI/MecI/CopY family transcriptional regulator [Brevundimonas sp.]|uniref:BlaI/MecI/CopY family transcriptional regulator n=1 Tax=Brevundimonas sp. TaxID=1871086 RepID=UPI00248729ED|nr:BlaI/MecI/CopY family transcriptional regulator [Brevundimonas sp.]MDI1280601.1 BlaI/MecI/CopY family transcriptional regulator [Brevundimonas sp.]
MIESLPRREREVFEILCQLEEGTAGAVRNAMSGSPSDSAVRTLLSRLKAKGLIAHRTDNQAYVYAPVLRPEAVADGALRRLVNTFFNGSPASAATALLGLASQLDPEELAALRRAIDDAGERQS